MSGDRASIAVSVIGDTKVEADETLFVNLTSADPFEVKIVRGLCLGAPR